MTSEAGPEERERQIAVLRKRMGRALRRDERGEYDRLSAVYAAQKAEHVTKTHEEYVAERRAARAALRAQERVVESSKPWRLPRGFASPLAARRAREGRAEVPVIPVGRPALSPWRRVPSMSEVIWRPGR